MATPVAPTTTGSPDDKVEIDYSKTTSLSAPDDVNTKSVTSAVDTASTTTTTTTTSSKFSKAKSILKKLKKPPSQEDSASDAVLKKVGGDESPESSKQQRLEQLNEDNTTETMKTLNGVTNTSPNSHNEKKGDNNDDFDDDFATYWNALKLKSSSSSPEQEQCRYEIKPASCYPPNTLVTIKELYRDMLKPSATVHNCDSLSSCFDSHRGGDVVVSSSSSKMDNPVTNLKTTTTAATRQRPIGLIKVEVLACLGLPHTSTSRLGTSRRIIKPNTVTYLILGSSAFSTDVIENCSSPLWPSQSRRAASFPLHHLHATLHVGVFDEKNSRSGGAAIATSSTSTTKRTKKKISKSKRNDIFVGRVGVDVCRLRPRTVYDVTLPLRASEQIYERKAVGVVRLRIEMTLFDERRAVLSYWTTISKTGDDGGFVPDGSGDDEMIVNDFDVAAEGHCPTTVVGRNAVPLPCADPETFRNVALTIYGKHLPGVFSQRVFKATTRELDLYRYQIEHLLKRVAYDIMTWKTPILSGYVFFAWMSCVFEASAGMVPVYTVGFFVVVMLRGYGEFVMDGAVWGGYTCVSMGELIMCLIAGSLIKPLKVERRNAMIPEDDKVDKDDAAEEEKVLLDHMEFPFSERYAYKRMPLTESLAGKYQTSTKVTDTKYNIPSIEDIMTKKQQPKTDTKSQNNRKSRTKTHKDVGDDNDDTSEDDMDSDTSDPSDNDDNNNDRSSYVKDDEQPMTEGSSKTTKNNSNDNKTTTLSTIPVGPEQNDAVLTTKKSPGIVHDIRREEQRLHRLTHHFFREDICDYPLTAEAAAATTTDNDPLSQERNQRRRRSLTDGTSLQPPPLDEFDKRLGLRTKPLNPMKALTSEFTNPIIRLIRFFLLFVRVSVSIYTWKDPYLSFWITACGLALMVVLAYFPWRLFLGLVGILCLGPQNVFFEKEWIDVLNKSLGGKSQKYDTSPSSSSTAGAAIIIADAKDQKETTTSVKNDSETTTATTPKNNISTIEHFMNSWGKKQTMTRTIKSNESSTNTIDENHRINNDNGSKDNKNGNITTNRKNKISSIKAFTGTTHYDSIGVDQPDNDEQQQQYQSHYRPRNIFVPYGPFKMYRFNDWPPRSIASSAVPVEIKERQRISDDK